MKSRRAPRTEAALRRSLPSLRDIHSERDSRNLISPLRVSAVGDHLAAHFHTQRRWIGLRGVARRLRRDDEIQDRVRLSGPHLDPGQREFRRHHV